MQDYYFNMDVKSTNVRHKNIRQIATASLLHLLWAVAPGLTRRMLLNLFFSPRPYRTNTQEEAIVANGRPFQFKVYEKTIRGWRWGRGPEVLLVHGWNGRGIQLHGFIEPLTASGYTAVAIDGPAHGASSGKVTSYFEFTDVLRKLLTEEREARVQGIIAHSFGAASAINALAKENLAIKTVCIAPVLRLQELLFSALDHYGIPQRLYHSLIREFEARYGYHLDQDNPRRLLNELSGPLLIVHDVRDRTVPYRDSAHQAQALKQIELWSTKGLGHKRILHDGEVVEQCVAYLKGGAATMKQPNGFKGAAMNTLDTLLNDYAASDDERRLSMFLTHRELRREFVAIDAAEWRKAKMMAAPAKPSAGPETALRRAAGYCRGWLRYCRPLR